MGEDVGMGLLLCICDSEAGGPCTQYSNRESSYSKGLISDHSARIMFTEELSALTKWLASRMLV